MLLTRKLAQEGSNSVLLSKDSKESNRLHKSWKRSKFCRDVDKLLSGEQITPADEPEPRTDDEDSDQEGDVPTVQAQPPVMLPEEDISPIAQFASPNVSRPTRPIAPNPLESASSCTSPSAAVVSLPPNSWHLLDIYFACTQSWLPICEKHDIMRVSYSYPETGLRLSMKDLPSPGDHAELWSVLAVGAYQAKSDRQESETFLDADCFYDIARELIPTESGPFATSHVRALLNLAVVNIGRTDAKAAWVLVGFASRILALLEQSDQTPNPRWKHLLASCFLLDGLLSLQLRRRPYYQSSNIAKIEKIDEDGLEEWQPWRQPWTSPLSPSMPPPMTPVFGLSSFNNLLGIADVSNMAHSERLVQNGVPPQQLILRLESWKTSLPSKFDYINNECKQTPVNPPALLLQLTHLCTLFALVPSPAYVHRILDLLERYHDQLGPAAIPPVVLCLLENMQMSNSYGSIEQRQQLRLDRITADIAHPWAPVNREAPAITPATVASQARPSFSGYQMPTPESIQVPVNAFTPLTNRPSSSRQRATTSLLEDLLPDINPATSTSRPGGLHSFGLPPLENDFRRPPLQHRTSAPSHDLETFFDELASLDGAERVDNQPQFMQNLGFAPDANMADFLNVELSQYIPANSTTFLPQSDPTHLDPTFFGAT